MTRSNSKRAHEASTLSRKHIGRLILEYVRIHPAETATEIARGISPQVPFGSQHNLPTCVYGLRDQGALRELPGRRCSLTGNKAATFEVTGFAPRPAKKKPHNPNTRKQGLLDAIEVVRAARDSGWNCTLTDLIEELESMRST
jgi:hypothetical protein